MTREADNDTGRWVELVATGVIGDARDAAAHFLGMICEVSVLYDAFTPLTSRQPPEPQEPVTGIYQWAARKFSLRILDGEGGIQFAGEGAGWTIQIEDNSGSNDLDVFEVKDRAFNVFDDPLRGQFSHNNFPSVNDVPFQGAAIVISEQDGAGEGSLIDGIEIPVDLPWQQFGNRRLTLTWADLETRETGWVACSLNVSAQAIPKGAS